MASDVLTVFVESCIGTLMNEMTEKLAPIAVAIACVCSLSTNAEALTITSPLTYDHPNVVGTIDGNPGFNTGKDAADYAQFLLDLDASEAGTFDGSSFQASNTEFNGTIVGDGIQTSGGAYQVPAGYEYVLAKYNGQNAGLVLFYIGGEATTLPQYPYNFWTTNTTKWGISNYTVFNSVSVPEGGATLSLLGAALLGFGALRRRFL